MQAMEEAIVREISMKRGGWEKYGSAETIYFGGGTPSLLSASSLGNIQNALQKHWSTAREITLEANPEDITPEALDHWLQLGINRLSIGIQSLHDPCLEWMNRKHSGEQALTAVHQARNAGFQHLSVDLIYGVRSPTRRFDQELSVLLGLPVDHLSAYILTIEERTALGHRVRQGIEKTAPDELVEMEYAQLCEAARRAGFNHYEVSNFARPGGYAQHNQHYWSGKPYDGIGPGAHAFDGYARSANVSHNLRYMQAVSKASGPNDLTIERDPLTLRDRYNETIMTGLRTQNGIVLQDLRNQFGFDPQSLEPEIWNDLIQRGELVENTPGTYRIPEALWLLADRISSQLFAVE